MDELPEGKMQEKTMFGHSVMELLTETVTATSN